MGGWLLAGQMQADGRRDDVKTPEETRLDYANAVRRAQQVEEAAGILGRAAGNDLPGCLRQAASGWKGEESGEFLSRGYALAQEMETQARELKRTAGMIRAEAQRIRNADIAAAEIAVGEG